jgi:chromosome segregation ATPase
VDYIQGHALGAVRRTYYTELRNQIEEKYPVVYHEKLDISNGNGTETKRRVSGLEEENKRLKEEIAKLQAQIAQQEQNSTSTNQEIASLKTALAQIQAALPKLKKDESGKFVYS